MTVSVARSIACDRAADRVLLPGGPLVRERPLTRSSTPFLSAVLSLQQTARFKRPASSAVRERPGTADEQIVLGHGRRRKDLEAVDLDDFGCRARHVDPVLFEDRHQDGAERFHLLG